MKFDKSASSRDRADRHFCDIKNFSLFPTANVEIPAGRRSARSFPPS